MLMMWDPYLIEETFVRNNKFLTKNSVLKNIVYDLMGESILMSESTEEWSKKRKVLSTAFYKDKLLKMISLVKTVVKSTMEDWSKRFVEDEEPFDLIEEVSIMHVRIMLLCALGEDIINVELPYYDNGKEQRLKLSQHIRLVFKR